MIIQMNTKRRIDVYGLFLTAVDVDEAGEHTRAEELYSELLESHCYPPALVNLGTIYFHLRRFGKAEECYRKAVEADPNYALALFNLGNALDEMDRIEEAATMYERAASLNHGDSHYNLALLYQRRGEERPALRHWHAYAKFDRSGPWADEARSQISKILERDGLQLVKTTPVKRPESGQLSLWPNEGPSLRPQLVQR